MGHIVKVQTSRFGELEIKETDIYTFPEEILGFKNLYKYFLLDHPTGGPFKWLQSLEISTLAFVTCDPLIFKSDYQIQIKIDELSCINIDNVLDSMVLVMMVIPKDPMLMTANLQAPLIFNKKAKLAKQFVLSDSSYEAEYRVFNNPFPTKRTG